MLKTNSKTVKNKIREAFAADAMGCGAEMAEWLRESPEDLKKAKRKGEWEAIESLANLANAEGSEKSKEAQRLAAGFIKETCMKEKGYNGACWCQSLFVEWLAGLPGAVDSAAWYCHSATNYVKDLLEETDEEAARYSEGEAEELIGYLFFREINQLAE